VGATPLLRSLSSPSCSSRYSIAHVGDCTRYPGSFTRCTVSCIVEVEQDSRLHSLHPSLVLCRLLCKQQSRTAPFCWVSSPHPAALAPPKAAPRAQAHAEGGGSSGALDLAKVWKAVNVDKVLALTKERVGSRFVEVQCHRVFGD